MYTLIGVDNKCFAIMDYTMSAMREQKFTELEIHKYIDDTHSGNYEHLVQVSNDMLDRCNERMIEPE